MRKIAIVITILTLIFGCKKAGKTVAERIYGVWNFANMKEVYYDAQTNQITGTNEIIGVAGATYEFKNNGTYIYKAPGVNVAGYFMLQGETVFDFGGPNIPYYIISLTDNELIFKHTSPTSNNVYFTRTYKVTK
jgi:hypothetical protein